MPQIIGSPIYHRFDKPQNVKVGNKVFNSVCNTDRRNYLDNNGVKNSVNYLYTQTSDIVVYESGGKVRYIDEKYLFPQKKTIGGQNYDRIISVTTDQYGNKRYEHQNSKVSRTIISTDSNGNVLNIQEPFRFKAAKKFSNFVGKVLNIFTKRKTDAPISYNNSTPAIENTFFNPE